MIPREQILTTIRNASWMPTLALRAASLLQDPGVDIGELTRTIEYDPGLTTNILRLANSTFFGAPRSIKSVREAIVRHGTQNILQLILMSTTTRILGKEIRGYDLQPGRLWEHSIAVAIATGHLASALKVEPPAHLFTTALLHDIGKVILGTYVEVDSAPILALAFEQQVSFEQAERQILGVDHAEVGAMLLESWNLPGAMVEAVRWHHQPDGPEHPDRLVTGLVHVADQFCLMCGIGAGVDGCHYVPSSSIVKELKITNQLAELVMSRITPSMDEICDLFNFKSGR
jgi:putative nucleotidyltransferase with HDIG domain